VPELKLTKRKGLSLWFIMKIIIFGSDCIIV